MSQGRLHSDDADDVATALREVDEVLGILTTRSEPEMLSTTIQDLVCQRDQARTSGDFALADEIRDTLTVRCYVVDDLPGGDPH